MPPLIVAGIVFYVGCYQLLIYTRRQKQRQDLTFGLTCLTAGFYVLFCAGLYSANSVAEGAQWQRAQVATLALFAVCFLWFIYDYTGCVSRKVLQLLSVYYIAAFLMGVLDRSELTWIVNLPSVKHITLPAGLEVTYYEATPGPVVVIQSVVGLLLGIYILGVSVQFYRSGPQVKAKWLLASVAIFLVGVINDTAVSSGLYQFVYVIEYSYLAIVLLMAYSLSNDVLEAAQIKDALRESEERFRTISELTSDFAYAITVYPDGSIVPEWVTGAFTRITGYLMDDFETQPTSRDWYRLVHPEDLPKLAISVQDISEQPFEPGEVRILTKAGEIRWLRIVGRPIIVDVSGQTGRIIGAAQDITERKRAEEALEQYMERLEILREIDRAILSAQSPQDIAEAALSHIHSLVSCQRASVVTFDYQANEARVLAVEGELESLVRIDSILPLGEFILDDGFERGEVRIIGDLKSFADLTPVRRELLQNGFRAIVNVPLIAQDMLIGSLNLASNIPEAFSLQQLEVARELADILAIAIQQARLDEQVQRHSQELEERVRTRTAELEAKKRELETFTYSVSHDLKAPLRGLDGYSRLLLESYEAQLDEDSQYCLHAIRRAAEQMNQLINGLLTYSRLERRSIEKEQVHLPALLESLLSERRDEIRNRNVSVVMNIACEYLTAEVEGLRQALRNLLDNALKFTQNVDQPRIEIGGKKTEKTCVLWVKDNGVGFDMRYHDRIFEMFHRLHRVEDYPGTGIGLALVYKVMQRLGGRVWAESAPRAGAIFYLEIPNEPL
ncbi:MAG: PAS domain-containing protein [Anaerolineales bacterium]|nr:PAS domain-containing protein [Anaerolineales bacterium]